VADGVAIPLTYRTTVRSGRGPVLSDYAIPGLP